MTKQQFKQEVILTLINNNMDKFVPDEGEFEGSGILWNREMDRLSQLKASQKFMAFSLNNFSSELVDAAYQPEDTGSGEPRIRSL